MHHGKTVFGGAALSAWILVTGCGGGAAASHETTPQPTASAGGEGGAASVTSAEGTASTAGAASPEMLAAGGERFEAVCGLCHPGGDEDNGPSIKDIHWDAPRMRAQIRNGSGRMRPISAARLSDEDLEKVVAWLGTIGAVR